MKKVFALITLIFSLTAFASLESGEYACDNEATLHVYKYSESYYSTFLSFPVGTGRMCTLDSLQLNGDSGVMFNEEYREIGKVLVSEESIDLDFDYFTVKCQK